MQWIGAAYAENSAPQFAEACSMLEFYCHLAKGESVLDVGCGDGRITHRIATTLVGLGGGIVIGVDLSESQIAHARATHHAPNLMFEIADALDLPSNFHHKFDWVVSFNCLHRVEDLKAAFTSLANCLKPGGRLVVSFPGFPPFMEGLLTKLRGMEKWKEYLHDAKDPFPWKVYPDYKDESQHGMKQQRVAYVERMEHVLTLIGLEAQQVEIHSQVYAFESEENYKEHVAQWLDDRQRVPEDRREEFMQDFLRLFRDAVKDRTFIDHSHYDPDKPQGTRTETLHVRILATKPLKK